MKRATYKAFTLIEMLIVMGILVILMVVGVAAGRFAIDRANQIAHQNGATQLYQALQSHFTDYGKFPDGTATLETMTENTANEQNALGKYLDMGSFKGGSEAEYFYFVNATQQAAIVCVTLGGVDDVTEKGISCVGNGFGLTGTEQVRYGGAAAGTPVAIDKEYYPADDAMVDTITPLPSSQWNGKCWSTTDSCI